jgi:hypothetical protein
VLHSEIDPSEYDVWSDPAESRSALVFLGLLAVGMAWLTRDEVPAYSAGHLVWALFFVVYRAVPAVCLLIPISKHVRRTLLPPTRLFAVRDDGIHVYRHGTTVLVPYALVTGAIVEVQNGISATVQFHRDARIGPTRLQISSQRGVQTRTVQDAEVYCAYVNARVAEARSTPKMRPTSVS